MKRAMARHSFILVRLVSQPWRVLEQLAKRGKFVLHTFGISFGAGAYFHSPSMMGDTTGSLLFESSVISELRLIVDPGGTIHPT